jgi:hypothetical protein
MNIMCLQVIFAFFRITVFTPTHPLSLSRTHLTGTLEKDGGLKEALAGLHDSSFILSYNTLFVIFLA